MKRSKRIIAIFFLKSTRERDRDRETERVKILKKEKDSKREIYLIK